MKQHNVYLAGPMRGLENSNYPAFHAAETELATQPWVREVFNPAKQFNGDTTKSLREYFAVDFEYLVKKATTIAFLPGWEGSEGSLIEHAIARALELDFILLPERSIRDASEWPEFAPVAYEAHRLVFGDRGAAYGHPAANFQDIADAWNVQLGTQAVDAVEVADMMTLFKIARGKNGYKRDNLVDAIGYQIAKQRVVDNK